MAASQQELDEAVHDLAEKVMELLGQRLQFGSMTLHFHEGHVARVELNSSYRPERRALRRDPLDNGGG